MQMTIQDLGSIGELVGSVATVATLAYLALQIRQSNKGERVSSYFKTADQITSTVMALALSDEMSRIWVLGLSSPDELSADERRRFELMMVAYLHQNQAEYLAHVHGFGEPDVWAAKKREFQAFFDEPGLRSFWPRYRSMLGTEFVAFVEDLMRDAEKTS